MMKKFSNLELMRRVLQLQQNDFAKDIGCASATISAYEREENRNLSLKICNKILDYAKKMNYSLTIDDLIAGRNKYLELQDDNR